MFETKSHAVASIVRSIIIRMIWSNGSEKAKFFAKAKQTCY
jgi:hypothetical protein